MRLVLVASLCWIGLLAGVVGLWVFSCWWVAFGFARDSGFLFCVVCVGLVGGFCGVLGSGGFCGVFVWCDLVFSGYFGLVWAVVI